MTPELAKTWQFFLETTCQDLLVEDFYNSPPEDYYEDPDEELRLPAEAWVNGPCWDLSIALRLFLNLSPESIVGISSHSAVRVGDFFLDGEGIHTKKQFLKRWEKIPGFLGQSIKPVSHKTLIDYSNPEFALRIAKRMRTHLQKDDFLNSLLSPGQEV